LEFATHKRMAELKRILSEEGISLPFEKFGQGYKSMSLATKAFEELNRQLLHEENPVLTWAVSNISIERDAAGNRKPNKDRSRERIDPAVASIMGRGSRSERAGADGIRLFRRDGAIGLEI
jgi:phage terminase large subunit-like protein